MRLLLRRVLIVLGLLSGAAILWALTITFVLTILIRAEEVRNFYGWIP